MTRSAVRAETGAMIKPGPMVTAVPERTVDDDQLAVFAAGSGFNGSFLADQLSGWMTHDLMGVCLFSMLSRRTPNPILAGLYDRLRASATEQMKTWEELIGDLGGNPKYVSPTARMTGGMDGKIISSFLLSGSGDELTFETAGLNAAFATLSLDVLNAQSLTNCAEKADDGQAKQVLQAAAMRLTSTAEKGLSEVEKALSASMLLQLNSGSAQKVMHGVDKAASEVKNILRS
ncbi:hypothetical protein O7623_22245 [Solwaraspora sp. WMMD791]|uniref:hypothetical protein n=1 Tax=Solwaraspora sp. WMMD791 TaxID=3016086 RepID=UPI00249BE8C7|nr:hypothetical protein [Solwaraspora sp. WMMD791]WFE26060.1 hypothetical protein O7623_22245 [Solwaraspora sp. WMMD791]